MFGRCSEQARKVMALANQEAQRFNHEFIGPEHILLGLVKAGAGSGAQALKNLGIDLHKVRMQVEKISKPGPDMVVQGKLPQTPMAKKVIDSAIEEAGKLGSNFVGTEHLLLGLLNVSDTVVLAVFRNLNIDPEEIRREVKAELGERPEEAALQPKPAPKLECKIFTFGRVTEGEKEITRFLAEDRVSIVNMAQSSAMDNGVLAITVTIIYSK